MNVIPKALGEQRADGTVNQARAEHGIAAGASFSLDESAGNLSRRIHLLLVVHRQREEVNALTRSTRSRRRHQDYGIAIANQNSAICLLCHFPMFYGELSSAQLNFETLHNILLGLSIRSI